MAWGKVRCPGENTNEVSWKETDGVELVVMVGAGGFVHRHPPLFIFIMLEEEPSALHMPGDSPPSNLNFFTYFRCEGREETFPVMQGPCHLVYVFTLQRD